MEVLDLLDRDVFGHVGRLAHRPAEERLHGRQHADVALVVDRVVAHRAGEHRQMLGGQVRRADDRLLGVDVGDDVGDLGVVVAEVAKRPRHGLVDDRHRPAADELLRLDEAEVGLDPGRVAVEHERNRAGRRQDRCLRVAHAVLLAVADRRLPRLLGGADDVGRHGVDALDALGGIAVHAQDAEHVLLVGGEPGERAHPRRRAGRGGVGVTGHQRRDRRRPRPPGDGVVRQPEGHQQRHRGWCSRGRAGGSRGRSRRSSRSGSRLARRGSPGR